MISDSLRLPPNRLVFSASTPALGKAETLAPPPSPRPEPIPQDQASIQNLRSLTDQALRELTEKAIQAGLSGQLLGALGAALNLGQGGAPAPIRDPEFPILSNPGGSLDDVGGLPGAKDTFRDLVEAFQPDRNGLSREPGALGPPSVPYQGYLVHGWSGSGKSHLVKSLAGELERLEVPVIQSGSGDFHRQEDDGNGLGPDRLRNLFRFAQEKAVQSPAKSAVIVLEDIDALLPVRGETNLAANAMVSAFSQEMSQAAQAGDTRLVVIGTTSRKDLVDISAANRLEKEVFLANPRDAGERREILEKIAEQNRWKPENKEILKELAETTPGRTARELKSILQAAAVESGETITEKALAEARLTHFYGPAQPINTPQWFFRLSVAHELGHAVIRHFLDGVADQDGRPDAKLQAIDQLVFQPRGNSSASVSLKYSGNPTKSYDYYFGEIASNYGGRAAEYIFGNGHLSAGPGNDIEFASRLAKEAVTEKGMGAQTGPVNPAIAEVAPEKVSEDIAQLLSSADEASTKIVRFYQDFIGAQADSTAARAFNQQSDDLVMSGKDFKNLLTQWELTRSDELQALRAEVRALRDRNKPQLAGL